MSVPMGCCPHCRTRNTCASSLTVGWLSSFLSILGLWILSCKIFASVLVATFMPSSLPRSPSLDFRAIMILVVLLNLLAQISLQAMAFPPYSRSCSSSSHTAPLHSLSHTRPNPPQTAYTSSPQTGPSPAPRLSYHSNSPSLCTRSQSAPIKSVSAWPSHHR